MMEEINVFEMGTTAAGIPMEPTPMNTSLMYYYASHHTAFKVGMAIHHYYTPFISVVGIVGNVLGLIVMLQPHNRKLSCCVYLGALAVSDNIALISSFALWYVTSVANTTDDRECQAIAMFFQSGGTCSTFIIVAVTLDRFLATCFPVRSIGLRTWKKSVSVTIFIYILSFLLNIPFMMMAKYVDNEQTLCTGFNRINDIASATYAIANIFLFSLLPFGVILAMNIGIIKRIRKMEKKKEKGQVQPQNGDRSRNTPRRALNTSKIVFSIGGGTSIISNDPNLSNLSAGTRTTQISILEDDEIDHSFNQIMGETPIALDVIRGVSMTPGLLNGVNTNDIIKETTIPYDQPIKNDRTMKDITQNIEDDDCVASRKRSLTKTESEVELELASELYPNINIDVAYSSFRTSKGNTAGRKRSFTKSESEVKLELASELYPDFNIDVAYSIFRTSKGNTARRKWSLTKSESEVKLELASELYPDINIDVAYSSFRTSKGKANVSKYQEEIPLSIIKPKRTNSESEMSITNRTRTGTNSESDVELEIATEIPQKFTRIDMGPIGYLRQKRRGSTVNSLHECPSVKSIQSNSSFGLKKKKVPTATLR